MGQSTAAPARGETSLGLRGRLKVLGGATYSGVAVTGPGLSRDQYYAAEDPTAKTRPGTVISR